MAHRRPFVCPWWIGWLLASPIRRLIHDPGTILASYVHAGMAVLEPGPGMGFFTVELARRVGAGGRVVAVDLQPQMLAGVRRRAARAGLLDRMDLRLATRESLQVSDLAGTVDFALVFAVVHELPAAAPFFREVAGALKPGGALLLVEPRGHVNPTAFEAEVQAAREAGLQPTTQPAIRRSRAALLKKPI
ncbi:MAG TPA: methyltransferase domain-containing protein [Candidatus Sulfotelmatobacter sp.]|nr:methyltransferase domain-containing protein [Candidatus Sulfotelmatobacter sp.]